MARTFLDRYRLGRAIGNSVRFCLSSAGIGADLIGPDLPR